MIRKFYSPNPDEGGGTEADKTTAKENEILSQVENEPIAEAKPLDLGKQDFSLEDLEKTNILETKKGKAKVGKQAKQEDAATDSEDDGAQVAEEKKSKKQAAKNKQVADNKDVSQEADKDAASKANSDEDESSELVFKVPDSSDDEQSEEQESTWQNIGKQFGVELKTDDFEEFQTAINKKIADAAVESGQELLDKEIESFDPEAKELFQFLKNKGKLSDFVNPTRKYDEFLALDSETLVRKNLELNGWDDEDKINEQVETLKAENKLETEAYRLKKALETGKKQFTAGLFAKQQQSASESSSRETTQRKQEDKQVIGALNKVTEFQGGKLPQGEREKIAKRWESGYYRKAFANNPEFVINAILSYELKDQIAARAEKKGFKAGRDENQDSLHNIKRLGSQESGSRSTKNIAAPGEGDFSAWKVELES